MKNKFLVKALTVCMLSLSLVSCKKDDEKANEIEDATGLRSTLTWTMTNGSSPATNADLDIFLYKGTGSGKTATTYSSEGITGTESFVLPSTLTDGDYTITVDHLDILANGSMSFVFKAESGSKTYNVSNIAFTTTDDNKEKDMMKVTKSGNKFTVTKL